MSLVLSSWSGSGEVWVPIANHLWQSTLFAGLAWFLTLTLKKNHAATRYGVWFAASLKFLMPFSTLVALGSRFSWLRPADSENGAIAFIIGGPFSVAKQPANPLAVSSLASLSLASLCLWATGFAAVLAYWSVRWRQTTRLLKSASTPADGRAVEILREATRAAQIEPRIQLKVAHSALQPGIVGIFRPVLFLPKELDERLSDEQLRAIVDHELCHVRRKDNLTAAVHMLTQAIFWFHPVVWWIGEGMMHERERACDETVLQLGNDPEAYAEGILSVCKFSLEAPRYLVAGVSGPELRKRIEAIMAKHKALQLDLKRKLLLTATAVAAVLAPMANGALHPKAEFGPGQQTTVSSAPKYVLGDLKIEGDVHDREVVRKRILEAWNGREFASVKELTDSILEVGVRLEFQNRGYFKVLALEPTTQSLGLVDGRQSIRVIAPVNEGEQYRVGKVDFQRTEPGKTLSISAATLGEQMAIRTGDLVNVAAVHEGIERIKKVYAERNSSAEVTPEIAIDDQQHVINVRFHVKESPK